MVWIRIQNQSAIINTQHIVSIFVNKVACLIVARIDSDPGTSDSTSFITLGAYKDEESCKRLLNILSYLTAYDKIHHIDMPSKEEVTDEWLEKCEKEIKNESINNG